MNKFYSLALILLGFVLTSQVAAKSPPPGTGKADMPANILFMVDTSGSMSGIVPSTNQMPFYMYDIDVDKNGNFVTLDSNSQLSKYSPAGDLIWRVGSYGSNFTRSNPQMAAARRMVIDKPSGNIFVADYSNSRILKFNSAGEALSAWNTPYPYSIGIDPDTRDLWVGTCNGYIKHYTQGGGLYNTYRTGFCHYGISVYNGQLYTNERNRLHRFEMIRGTLQLRCTYSTGYTTYDVSAGPKGVAYSRSTYYKGHLPLSTGTSCPSHRTYYDSRIYRPEGVGVDSTGNFYFVNPSRRDVIKFGNGVTTFLAKFGGNSSERRLDVIKKVVKRLVSDSELTSGANFGLINWDSYVARQLNIPITKSGASQIYSNIDRLRWGGATYADRAMRWAEQYLNSSRSPINRNATCQKTYLILLSDGGFSDRTSSATTAARLLSTKGVKTFVVGFNSGTQSTYAALAAAGGTNQPLYADSWQQLYSALTDAIRQAITSNLSFTTPMIMPAQSGGQDHLIQPQFTYKSSNQWEGHLKKYKLNADGSLGSMVWNAGTKLNSKSASSRNIWGPLRWSGVGDSFNNFTESNKSALKTALYTGAGYWPSDTEVTALIRHTRGIDAYDEDGDNSTSDERWKLGDIYHGVPAVVGAPSASVTNEAAFSDSEAYYRYQKNYQAFSQSSRREIVYAPSNDGMLHAFNSSTGDEQWAFIPPNIFPKLREKISSKANTSNAIYAVDGSPTVKDVYYQNKWRTVLFGGLGRGGHGYYALDITNPDNPDFLFAFSNYPTESKVRYWDTAGNMQQYDYATAPAEYDFSKLGEAWSTPQIFLMPYGASTKWVAVFGAGYNGGTNTSYGSSVYVIDLENSGKLLKRIDLTDNAGGVANSVPADISLVTADTTNLAKFKGAMAYVTDLESKLWKINLTDKGTLYAATQIFNGQGDDTNGRLSFFAPALSVDTDGKLWAYYGTGDQQRLQHMSSNISNRIFGIRDEFFPSFKSVTTQDYRGLRDTTRNGSMCPTDRDLGWFNSLNANEKVTGKIAVNNETIFASRYTPNNVSVCSPGTGKLTEHDYRCGNVYAGGSHNLGAGIPTGAVVYKNRIYVGSSSTSQDGLAAGFVKTDNIIVGASVKGNSGAGAANIESWRELF